MNLRCRSASWPPEKGSPCWVKNAHTMRALPAGLEDRTAMVYLGRDPEDRTRAVLQRTDGAIFRLAHNQYEHPRLWQVGSEWLPESDPRVRTLILDAVESLKLEGCDPAIQEGRRATIRGLEWIIERNAGSVPG